MPEELKKEAEKPILDPGPPPEFTSPPLPATTTEQEDVTTAGQRRINLIWEITQATLALGITAAFIFSAIKTIESKELTWAFISVVTAYLVRTNHQAIGGIGVKPIQKYEGR